MRSGLGQDFDRQVKPLIKRLQIEVKDGNEIQEDGPAGEYDIIVHVDSDWSFEELLNAPAPF